MMAYSAVPNEIRAVTIPTHFITTPTRELKVSVFMTLLLAGFSAPA
jgi:hypothetical protein